MHEDIIKICSHMFGESLASAKWLAVQVPLVPHFPPSVKLP